MSGLPIADQAANGARAPGTLWSWLQRLRHRAFRPTSRPPERSAEDERRFQNRRLLDQEIRDEAIVLESQPTSLILEPATACNLKCPFCPTGGGYSGLAKEILTPEMFERIMATIDATLLDDALLYNWGEPFLNRHLPDYLEYFGERGVFTEISVNLSTRDYDTAFLERIVKSGIGRILVSIDGATQEAYEKYRVGGNLERVLRNMTGLAEAKARLGLEHPEIFYKMLLNRFNEHEVEQAQQLAAECGVEFRLDDKFWCPDEHREDWIARAVSDRPAHEPMQALGESDEGLMSTFCRQLWDTLVVNANGAVLPCCLIFQQEHSVGNLLEQPLEEVRNGQPMQTLRRFVTDAGHGEIGMPNHCEHCDARWCSVRDANRKQALQQLET